MLGLVDVADIAVRLGYSTEDDHLMAQLNVAIADVGAVIEAYCQTSFAQYEGARVYNGADSGTVSLKDFATAVSKVEIESENGTWETVTGWALQPSNPRRKDGAGNPLYTFIVLKPSASVLCFPKGIQNVKVTGTFGMTKLPTPVIGALAMGIRHWFNLRDYDATKVINSGAGRTVEEAQDVDYLPRHAKTLLDMYTYKGIDNS